MSHLRVLICRVEDETEQMTALASVDLPPMPGQWGTRRWTGWKPTWPQRASDCWGGCVNCNGMRWTHRPWRATALAHLQGVCGAMGTRC